MPIADTTKIPWTIIFGLFLAFYFIGSRFKDSKNMKRTMSISWVLLPLFIFSWIFKKPEIDLPTILGQDIPIFIGIFLIGALTITFINNPIVEKYFSIYLGVLIAITGIALFISIPILLKSALLLLVLFTIVIPAVSSSAKGKRNLIIVWGVSLFTLSVLIRGGSSDTQIIVQLSLIHI